MPEKHEQQRVTKSNSTLPISATSKTSDLSHHCIRITATVGEHQWNELVTQATQATPFHRYEFLETIAEHTGTTFYPIVGLENDDPTGLFPVFEKSVGPFTVLFSPAPNLKVRYLGPVLLDRNGSDPAEDEQRRLDFLTATLSCLDDRFSPSYVLVRTAVRFGDHRPFLWEDFEATPQYSYVVDLTPESSTLLDRFSSDARNNIRTETPGLTIAEEGSAAIAPIIDQLRTRHEEQGKSYRVTADFVTDLYERLPDGVVRPYVVRQGDGIVGGMIALEYGDTVYRWQGGAKPEIDLPVNELLDWHIMQRAAERGCRRYDLVGANHRGISRYKSKFDPELVAFQSLVRSTWTMDLLSELYLRFR